MSHPPQIAHIITTLELGGAQKHALLAAHALQRSGYTVHVIAGAQGALQEYARSLPVHRMVILPWLKRRIAPLADLAVFFYLIFYFKRYRISLVHTHSSKAGVIGRWAAWCAGVPVRLHTVHGWSFHDGQPRPVRRAIIWLERLTAAITDRLIVVCRSDLDKGVRNAIAGMQRYVLIRYGIDQEAVQDQAGPADRLTETPLTIGMVACLKPQKNPQEFIRMAAQVAVGAPQARFWLIGDGVLRSRLQRMIRKHRLDGVVRLCGWRTDIYRVLQACDVVVLTSRWEGAPIALLEAMVLAKPIVAYGVDGVPELLDDIQAGYVVPPGNFRKLTECVAALCRNPELRRRIGRNARRRAQSPEFTEAGMMAAVYRLYAACGMPPGAIQN